MRVTKEKGKAENPLYKKTRLESTYYKHYEEEVKEQ